ncbi:lysophospholipid acyltransferase family protein [Butyricicoccus sp.]|uniref:lysophospholipid acyltransferase family protein n=1 Tax=Butyricicoccus sp. TaxID=2049021 RepID=UPI003F1438F4
MKWFFCAAAGIALIALICLPLSWALLWQLPLAFFAALLGAMLLYWLFLAIVSLSIQKQRDYDAPSPFYYRLLNSGYRFLCSCGRVRIHVSGIEKIPTDRRFLLISNHLSRFDPMVQSIALGENRIAYISKPENFSIPVGGRFVKRCCYLPIDRDNVRNAIGTIKKAAGQIASGAISVGVYPEGHRGSSYELQEFRTGCLNTALLAKCPIVVTTISGTEKIHRNFPFRHTDVFFDVLDTVDPYGKRTVDLSQEFRLMMQEQLNKRKEG